MTAKRPKKQHKKSGRPQRTPEEVAENGGDTCEKPKDWEKAVSAAYLRYVEWRRSRKDVASALGMGERTLARWEISPWWRDAQADAMARWCGGVVLDSCRTVSDAINDGDVQTARWALERLMPAMAPPRVRNEHTGEGGGPIETRATVVQYPINKRDETGEA